MRISRALAGERERWLEARFRQDPTLSAPKANAELALVFGGKRMNCARVYEVRRRARTALGWPAEDAALDIPAPHAP